MRKEIFMSLKKLLTSILLVLCINVWNVSYIYALDSDDEMNGDWDNEDNNRSINYLPITVSKSSNYLTIQDSNPVNTITVKITSNETGATVFENVYPQGQTSFIVIPINGWSAGSYTIELFGRENNGYLWGTFQVLP